MDINIYDSSTWNKLPVELQAILSKVQTGNFPYPGRENDWGQALGYLGKGNFPMAQFTLEQIQKQQHNLRN